MWKYERRGADAEFEEVLGPENDGKVSIRMLIKRRLGGDAQETCRFLGVDQRLCRSRRRGSTVSKGRYGPVRQGFATSGVTSVFVTPAGAAGSAPSLVRLPCTRKCPSSSNDRLMDEK
jgi:hypothetical protein